MSDVYVVPSFTVHVFLDGTTYEVDQNKFSRHGIDVGPLSSDDQIKGATEQVLSLQAGELSRFVVDPGYDRRESIGADHVTVRPQERFG